VGSAIERSSMNKVGTDLSPTEPHRKNIRSRSSFALCRNRKAPIKRDELKPGGTSTSGDQVVLIMTAALMSQSWPVSDPVRIISLSTW